MLQSNHRIHGQHFFCLGIVTPGSSPPHFPPLRSNRLTVSNLPLPVHEDPRLRRAMLHAIRSGARDDAFLTGWSHPSA